METRTTLIRYFINDIDPTRTFQASNGVRFDDRITTALLKLRPEFQSKDILTDGVNR